MKVLVLGSKGFLGKALINNLKYSSVGLEFPQNHDLEQKRELFKNFLLKEKPTVLVNCIGSFSNIFSKDFDVNALITEMILDSIKTLEYKIQIFLIGSAAEYKDVDRPVSEKVQLEPSSIYGLSKKIQFEICRFYRKKFNMKINYLRPFNISGYSKNRNLLIGEIYHQIEKNKKNNSKHFSFGNLGGNRDYLSLEKFTDIINKLIQTGIQDSTLNIGSGKSVEVREFVKQTIYKSGIKNPQIDEKRILDSKSYKNVIADISELKKLIGEI